MLADIFRIDRDRLAGTIGSVERDLVEHSLHNRLQATGADVLDAGIELDRDVSERIDGIVGEVELHFFRLKQRLVLADEARLGLRQDAAEVFLGQRPQFDADRQTALKRAEDPTASTRGTRPRR